MRCQYKQDEVKQHKGSVSSRSPGGCVLSGLPFPRCSAVCGMLPLHSSRSAPSSRIAASACKHTNFTPSSTFTKPTLSTTRLSPSRSPSSPGWSSSPTAATDRDRKWSISSICWTLPPLSRRNSCTARSVHRAAITAPDAGCESCCFKMTPCSFCCHFTEVSDDSILLSPASSSPPCGSTSDRLRQIGGALRWSSHPPRGKTVLRPSAPRKLRLLTVYTLFTSLKRKRGSFVSKFIYFICNHKSFFRYLLLTYLCVFSFSYLSKKTLFHIFDNINIVFVYTHVLYACVLYVFCGCFNKKKSCTCKLWQDICDMFDKVFLTLHFDWEIFFPSIYLSFNHIKLFLWWSWILTVCTYCVINQSEPLIFVFTNLSNKGESSWAVPLYRAGEEASWTTKINRYCLNSISNNNSISCPLK